MVWKFAIIRSSIINFRHAAPLARPPAHADDAHDDDAHRPPLLGDDPPTSKKALKMRPI